MAGQSLLVGDIGGTNARFALADRKTPGFASVRTYQCADFVSADLAIKAYLRAVRARRPAAICIAAAGPIVEGSVRFTNNSWQISTRELQQEFDVQQVRLLNDFEAIAYSVPWLGAADVVSVGMPSAADLQDDEFNVAIIGPGTGLGAAGLCKRGSLIFPIVGEGGHLGFAPETQLQVELHAQLRTRFDRVSDERLVSGPGLQNIFLALGAIRGENTRPLSPAEIFSESVTDGKSVAAEAVQLFYEILGQVAGNLVLALGAFDGVYIAGGIVQRNPAMISGSRFRAGFEMKGRHRPLMERTPTSVILHENPGLLGASYCALQMKAP
jgi:glucokinase